MDRRLTHCHTVIKPTLVNLLSSVHIISYNHKAVCECELNRRILLLKYLRRDKKLNRRRKSDFLRRELRLCICPRSSADEIPHNVHYVSSTSGGAVDHIWQRWWGRTISSLDLTRLSRWQCLATENSCNSCQKSKTENQFQSKESINKSIIYSLLKWPQHDPNDQF